MYTALMAAIAIITIYVIVIAITGRGNTRFSICLIVGTIIGALCAIPFYENVSHNAGHIALAVVIAIAFMFGYTNIWNRIINLIPEAVRNGFVTFFRVVRTILTLTVIVGAVVGVLTIMGI